MKTVTLLLQGGLGNQMFQYAFARSLVLRNGGKLRISRRFLNGDTFGRSYSLDRLNIPDDVSLMTKSEELKAHSKIYMAGKIHGLLRKLKGLERSFYSDGFIFIYVYDFDKYIPEIMNFKNDNGEIIIKGYFQSEKYFHDYRSELKKEFQVLTPPSPENEALINEISGCESVCVHVRRGDYLKLKQWADICDYEYYFRAMKYISEKVSKPVFYIFSNSHDDISWIKENWNFSSFISVKYIDMNNPDYEELRLMYSCRHFIIANSSFSWWAAYLSENPEKIICSPSKWTNEKKGIYLPEWKIINCERNE